MVDGKFLWNRDKAYLMKKPSIDRINNDGNYTRENCQFIEHGDNISKAHSIPVFQFDLKGNFIKEIIKTISIIDDLPDNLEVIGDLVSDECEVFCSLSGCEGLELARTVQPDLILLDIMMPQMDGYEVCRVLKQDPLTCDSPVIMVTAFNQAEDEPRGIELGAIDYVTKPTGG